MKYGIFAALVLAMPAAVHAQDSGVAYGPAPDWVVPPPAVQSEDQNPEGPFHFLYSDVQIRALGEGTEQYTSYRVKLLRPEALSIGNTNVSWVPDAGTATVHRLRIIRDGDVIDLLKDHKFSVFQPQGGIEYSILSGLQLANLQAPGLRVGDELEFAATITTRERALPDNSYGLGVLGAIPAPGSFRLRLSWPDGEQPTWKVSEDLADIVRVEDNALEVQMQDPAAAPLPEGAPPRFAMKRLLEFSDFRSWSELSSLLYPLFHDAAVLPGDSQLKKKAAAIVTEHDDPIERARAALRLVQNEIRYVYVGLNGGNLLPATAEETWDRRYGDCKAKTVLLMALLAEMGIESHPVAVSSSGGDGINEHLPNPGFFDHVMVQARIGKEWYWLDGTRTGDVRMRTAPPEFYEWVMPLTDKGAELVSVDFEPLALPNIVNVTEIDARAGYDTPADITLRRIIRGANALNMRNALLSLTSRDAETSLKSMLSNNGGFEQVVTASWDFDELSAALIIDATAKDTLDWEPKDGGRIWDYGVPGAGFYAPPRRTRPAEFDQDIPWRNDPNRFSCYATTIHLPEPEEGRAWSHSADAVDDLIGGVAYWRMADLEDGTIRTVMASRTMKREISAEDAQSANRLIPDFDNSQSHVYQITGPARWSEREISDPSIKAVPGATGHDWLKDPSPCIAPDLRD